jgi:hypothetical protein
MRSIFIVLVLSFIIGCGSSQSVEFVRQCQELSVRSNVAREMQKFKNNRGGDNEARFEILRAYCMRRQLYGPRDEKPELVDPLLDTNSIVTLLGQPDVITNEGTWIYYFNATQDWHLELSFREEQLLRTSYRQLMSIEEFTTNKRVEQTGSSGVGHPKSSARSAHP